jgi:hypothetical protein
LVVTVDAFPDQVELLDGTEIWGRARIMFVGPPGTTSVNFWLDSTAPAGPSSADGSSPFDFAQTADGTGFFDTSQLANGQHTMTATAIVNGTPITESAPFTVAN